MVASYTVGDLVRLLNKILEDETANVTLDSPVTIAIDAGEDEDVISKVLWTGYGHDGHVVLFSCAPEADEDEEEEAA